MSCSKCNLDKPLVNKHFKLCRECNNERLHGDKYGKRYNMPVNKKKRIQTRKKPLERKPKHKSNPNKIQHVQFIKPRQQGKMLQLDEAFYKSAFESCSDHRCEECGTRLPDTFSDADGKVIARWRYSHIIPKSVAPELRHDVNNINHLCLKHHQQWDFGDKKSMRIYEINKARFPWYFS